MEEEESGRQIKSRGSSRGSRTQTLAYRRDAITHLQRQRREERRRSTRTTHQEEVSPRQTLTYSSSQTTGKPAKLSRRSLHADPRGAGSQSCIMGTS